MSEFADFVIEHEGDDVTGLVLQRNRWPGIDVAQAASTIAGRRKMRTKAPSWYACAEVVYPSRLCVEQCSSEAACGIKCTVLREVCAAGGPTLARAGLRIADLTGGLGVDSAAFAKMGGEVLYIEKDSELAAAAKHNFAALGHGNVLVLNAAVTPEGILPVAAGTGPANPACWEAVREFAPDVIYLDPARRSSTGSKVFKLEDCRPDVLQLKESLLKMARFLVVKLSPMADIDIVLRQLGPRCRRLDVISIDGECKEILVTMDREHSGECLICADCGQANSFCFFRSEEAAAVPTLATSADESRILLEPDKALMKAAPFKLLSQRLGLIKLDISTHYYMDNTAVLDPETGCDTKMNSGRAGAAERLFRQFRTIKVAPLDKKSLRTIGREFPRAEVTARNIPLSSDELRKRLEVKAKSDTTKPAAAKSAAIHIFGLRIADSNYLVVTEKL